MNFTYPHCGHSFARRRVSLRPPSHGPMPCTADNVTTRRTSKFMSQEPALTQKYFLYLKIFSLYLAAIVGGYFLIPTSIAKSVFLFPALVAFLVLFSFVARRSRPLLPSHSEFDRHHSYRPSWLRLCLGIGSFVGAFAWVIRMLPIVQNTELGVVEVVSPALSLIILGSGALGWEFYIWMKKTIRL